MPRSSRSQHTAEAGLHLAGLAFEKIGLAFRVQRENDFGIDAHVELLDGEKATGRLIAVQVKSGPSYLSEQDADSYVFRDDAEHFDYWLNHSLPVIVCLCDIDSNTIYWDVVSSDTATSTGTGYKLAVPKRQMLSAKSLDDLASVFTRILAHDKYTIVSTEDISYSMAKRYSFRIVLNGTFTKREIATIVRQQTMDGARRRYYRNHLTAQTWGDTDAHVIWTFIYPSIQDLANNNLICRSLWISPDLSEQWRPSAFDGENVGDGIIVDWNIQYDLVAGLFSSNRSNKEEYLNLVLPLVQQLNDRLARLSSQLDRLSLDSISTAEFRSITQVDREDVTRLCREVSDLPTAPYECDAVDKLLQSAAGLADNISIFYAESASTNWTEESKLVQSREQCSAAQKELRALEYELDKIR